MQRKSRLILISMGIREGLDSGTLVGCLSLMFVLLTQTQTPMMGDPHKKIWISTSGAKRVNILRFSLSDDATSRRFFSVDGFMWEDTNVATKKLATSLSNKRDR